MKWTRDTCSKAAYNKIRNELPAIELNEESQRTETMFSSSTRPLSFMMPLKMGRVEEKQGFKYICEMCSFIRAIAMEFM